MGLLPRDEAFYTLFVDQSSRIVEAAGIFNAAFQANPTDWDAAIGRLDKLEVDGDACAHETVARLARSFITPFDPEDIHRLTVALNAVLDALNGLAQRCRIYGLESPPPEPMRRLADSVERGAKACHSMISALAADQDAPEALAEARRLEHEADKVYRSAMLTLFRSETDPRILLTNQQIYDGLEAATDRFEALSYLIAEIRLKNS